MALFLYILGRYLWFQFLSWFFKTFFEDRKIDYIHGKGLLFILNMSSLVYLIILATQFDSKNFPHQMKQIYHYKRKGCFKCAFKYSPTDKTISNELYGDF